MIELCYRAGNVQAAIGVGAEHLHQDFLIAQRIWHPTAVDGSDERDGPQEKPFVSPDCGERPK